MPLSRHLSRIPLLEQELPVQMSVGTIAGWPRACFYDKCASPATGQPILHGRDCPIRDCEVCDLEEDLRNLFFERLKTTGLQHGYGTVQLGKNGAATVDLLQDDRLVAAVKAKMKWLFSLEEFEKVDGLQMEIVFGVKNITTCLQRQNGRWSLTDYLMEPAYFLSLRETNGNDIERMVIHMEGDDFWIASDPPKPDRGFVAIEYADIATEGQLDDQGAQL